jgi:hypothetical protein
MRNFVGKVPPNREQAQIQPLNAEAARLILPEIAPPSRREKMMDKPRRQFLKLGTSAGVALIFSRVGELAAMTRQNQQLDTGIGHPLPRHILSDPLYNLTRKRFSETLDTEFAVFEDGGYVADLTLVHIELLNPPHVPDNPTNPKECFVLVFRGPTGLDLRQGTYVMHHKSLGNFELFMVPSATGDKGGSHYEALINRAYP